MTLVNGYTLKELAALTGRPVRLLRYAQRRGGIGPTCRLGALKLFSVADAAAILSVAARVKRYKRRPRR